MRARSLALAAAAILAGCAMPVTQRVAVSEASVRAEAERQREIAARTWVEEQKRLSRVHGLLATRAADLCGADVGPFHGAFTMRRPRGEMGDAFGRLYGVSEVLTVLFVLEGSPSDRAGLKAGDLVVRVNGVSSTDEEALRDLTEKLAPQAPIELELRRDGAPLALRVLPEKACRYPALVTEDPAINAFADGRRVLVGRGMMSFARDDNELALVLAHEMAHNVMKHMEARQRNMGLGLLADIAAAILSRGQVATGFAQMGAMAYSQEFEAEADYVGLYILAAAGLPIEGAPGFWRRMAAAHPASIRTNHAASHPSTAYRMVALEETVKEIRDKQAKGLPLAPNLKEGRAAPPGR